MTRTPRLALFSGAAILAGLVLLAIALRVGFGWYLNTEAFRRKLGGLVGDVLRAQSVFQTVRVQSSDVYSESLSASSDGAAFFSRLRADQIHADFNWRGLLHHAWQIDELTIERLDLTFAPHEPSADVISIAKRGERAPRSDWKLDLRNAVVQQSRWHWGFMPESGGSVIDSALRITPEGTSWNIAVNGGRLQQTGWPELEIESAQLHYHRGVLFVTESVLRNAEARVSVTGEMRFDEDAAELQATLSNVPLDPLLPPDWRLRLRGDVSGIAKIHAPLSDIRALKVDGTLTLVRGQLEAVPILNEIATFTHTERFRRLVLTKGSLDFNRDADGFSARNVVLESEGLLRLEGTFTVTGDRISGTFQLGLTPSSLQWLPGSQERVFTVARDGYLWTPIQISGPLAHPAEDLTPRLLAAGLGEILDDPAGAAQKAAESLLDLLKP